MTDELTPYEALQQAVQVAGSQSALGRICRVSQTAVWKWLQSSKRLPAEHVLTVENHTGISRHSLRPDIYPVDKIQRDTLPIILQPKECISVQFTDRMGRWA